MRFSVSDIRMPATSFEVEVWFIRGATEYGYPTKLAAEVVATEIFSNETADKRYSRIFFHRYVRES